MTCPYIITTAHLSRAIPIRSFSKNVMSDTGQRGRLVHNEQFAPFYGSVAFENAPNLHAGLYGTKSGRRGGSGARCFAASPFGLPGVSSVVPRRRLNGSHTIPQLLHELVVTIGFQYVIQVRNSWGAKCFLGDIMHPHLLLLAFQWFCVKPL